MAVVKRKRKRKNGKTSTFWEAEVFVSGVRLATQTFDTQAAAARWHDETKAAYESGRGAFGEMTLGRVIELYREKEFPVLVEGSRRQARNRLKLIEPSPVASKRMRDVDAHTVDTYLDWVLKHPSAENPNRTSFVKELKFLSVLFGFYREHYDERFPNPVMKRHFKRARYKGALPKKADDHFMPVDHANRWLAELRRQRDPLYRRLGQFQVIMGTRIGETGALCWDKVDFERGVVHIHRTMVWRDELGRKVRQIVNRTKTPESRRTLPMPPEVRELLLEARAAHPDSTVVFRQAYGHLVAYDNVRQAYNRAFEAAGLPWTATHICRDTNGTLPLLDEQVRTEAVRVNHGHTSVKQTEGYAKARAVVKNVVPETVARLLAGGEEKNPGRIPGRVDQPSKKHRENR